MSERRAPGATAQGACGGGARRPAGCLWQGLSRRAWPAAGVLLAVCGAGHAQAIHAQAIQAQTIQAHTIQALTITGATYDAPTTRYAHAVLGDAVEWGALVLTLSDGLQLRLTLPEARVFEDLAPRLADLDGDGAPEVIVIETDRTLGASLAIYDTTGKIAATPYIGRTNRWLAPVGAGDLDGDGLVELAYIDRPHLAKTLRIWRYVDRALVPVADLTGLTNHKIGWDFIVGGLRDCGTGAEMITADADWRSVMATRLTPSGPVTRPVAAYTDPSSFDDVMACAQ